MYKINKLFIPRYLGVILLQLILYAYISYKNSPSETLRLNAQKIQNTIIDKEKASSVIFQKDIIEDALLCSNDGQLDIINKFNKLNVGFFQYKHDSLLFKTSNIDIDISKIQDSVSLQNINNSIYLVSVKRCIDTNNVYTYLIKHSFPDESEYIRNIFNPDFNLDNKYLELSERGVGIDLFSQNNQYLFSVNLKSSYTPTSFSLYILWLVIQITSILLLLFIAKMKWVNKNYYQALFIGFIVPLLMRVIIGIKTNSNYFFNNSLSVQNIISNSDINIILVNLLINSLLILLWINFIRRNIRISDLSRQNRLFAFAWSILFIVSIYIVFDFLLYIIQGLVIRYSIDLDLTKVSGLTISSLLALLCIGLLIIVHYKFTRIVIDRYLVFRFSKKINLLLLVLIVISISGYYILMQKFNFYYLYILIILTVLIGNRNKSTYITKYLLFIVYAVITSSIIFNAIVNKRSEEQALIMQNLKNDSDFSKQYVNELINSDSELSKKGQSLNYSIGYFKDGRLVKQVGSKQIIELINKNLGDSITLSKNFDYEYFIKKVNNSDYIIISQKQLDVFDEIKLLSYIVCITISFYALIITLSKVVLFIKHNLYFIRIGKYRLVLKNISTSYKTKIQLTIIIGVVVSSLFAGALTILFLINQNKKDINKEFITLLNAISSDVKYPDLYSNTIKDMELLLSKTKNISLILYNKDGEAINECSDELFKSNYLPNKLNPFVEAYFKKDINSEYFISTDKLSLLSYMSAYTPIYDINNNIIAYLSLFYFDIESDEKEYISSVINSLIVVYLFLFLGIILVAFLLANKITRPLTTLQEHFKHVSVSSNSYKQIRWDSEDEIGATIKAYNKMLLELRKKTKMLTLLERENTWKEVAKQVAHEIKNPLTPMRLGIQHLEYAKKNNDPNFDNKFDKFCKSFINQIDSLSFIASEFSSFAKLPPIQYSKINLVSLIEYSANTFSSESIDIKVNDIDNKRSQIVINGDKDYLLRIFNNLIKNSIQANAKKIIVDIVLSADNNVIVSVLDDGYGISPENLTNIFYPNFTTKSSGMGLGLAFVKNTVEAMGGSISVSSEINSFTIFIIIFKCLEKTKDD